MNIETYEIEEVKGELGNLAADSEACELIEKLDLGGQRGLLDPKTETRFPYPKMDALQFFVYSTVYPQHDHIQKYEHGIIPLRCLQVAAFCKDQPAINHLEVWHTRDAQKDPILVGCAKEYAHADDVYLLARWGESLVSFDELKAQAAAIYKAKLHSALLKIQEEVRGAIQNIDALVAEKMESGPGSMPVFYQP